MNLLHQVIFIIKMGSSFTLFSATRLSVSKIDPAVIWSSRKIYDMISLLSLSILYHHILPLVRLWKDLKVHFELSGTQDMVNFFVCNSLLTSPTQVFSIFGVGRGPKIYKNWTRNGGENWEWCWKSVKNTHLLVITRGVNGLDLYSTATVDHCWIFYQPSNDG